MVPASMLACPCSCPDTNMGKGLGEGASGGRLRSRTKCAIARCVIYHPCCPAAPLYSRSPRSLQHTVPYMLNTHTVPSSCVGEPNRCSTPLLAHNARRHLGSGCYAIQTALLVKALVVVGTTEHEAARSPPLRQPYLRHLLNCFNLHRQRFSLPGLRGEGSHHANPGQDHHGQDHYARGGGWLDLLWRGVCGRRARASVRHPRMMLSNNGGRDMSTCCRCSTSRAPGCWHVALLRR